VFIYRLTSNVTSDKEAHQQVMCTEVTKCMSPIAGLVLRRW